MSTTRSLPSCLILFLSLLPHAVYAQATRGQTAGNDAFSVLLTEVETLGNDPAKRAATVANWIRQQSLSALSWQSQVKLLQLLEAPDRMDKAAMSVRWLGRISAPTDGQYVFEQLRPHRTVGKMRLWINDVLALDGHETEKTDVDADFEHPSFRSVPVALRAGVPTEFRLEYVSDSQGEAVTPSAPGSFPVAVLLWESETMERQIVPKEVFRQPVENQPGLRGEYFADAVFARKAGDRTDDAVEFIWDRDAVFNTYNELRKQIVRSLLPRITNVAFLAEMSDDDAAELATNLAPLLAATTATERSALIEAISSQPRLLKNISNQTLADQIQIVFMLPDRLHLDFVVRWSEASEVPVFEPGTMISGWGTYAINNVSPYWRIGQCFDKSHTQELYDIVDRHLQKEDGSCNLGLAYIVVSASRNHNRLGRVLARINEALADPKLSGDAKASWHLAKAFALETAMQSTIKPGRALPELRQALGAAESEEFQSRVQQELAARLLTLGRDEEARGLLSAQTGRASAQIAEGGSVQTTEIREATSFREQYAVLEQRRRALSIRHYVDSVRKHQESARQRNDTNQVLRLQNILTDFESKQQTEKK